MFPPSVSNSLQQYDAFRELWRKRGSLARAAAKYAQSTGDHVFAVQEMLREHHEWPIPGLWDSLKTEPSDEVTVQQSVRDALAEQRVAFRRGRNNPYTTLAQLQTEALAWMRGPRLGLPSEMATAAVAEACYKNVVLTARMLIEQQAMREALHSFGIHRSADDVMVTTMRRASDLVLSDLDSKLETGMLLEDGLAAEILIESLSATEA
jgi:hypothetical protein